MGDWAEPQVIKGDTASKNNAMQWRSLDAWIALQLNLSEQVQSQVTHLITSNKIWLKLKKLFKPASTTSITLHLTSIVNIRFDESTKFEDFVVSKHEHNRMLGDLGGQSLPDSYIAIIIRSGLPNLLKQAVSHISDDTITTDQLINIIHARQQESIINTMQSPPSNTALYGCQNKPNQKKRNIKPCKIQGCPKLEMHPTQNCWSPHTGGRGGLTWQAN